MANKDYKNGKLVEIIREFNHTGATRYEINGINQAIAVPFWRIAENKFNVIPKGSYKFINESGNNYLEITDNTILEQATQFQICYVYSQVSSKYIEEFPELSVMVNKYNELVDDATKLFSYLKSVGMTSDTLQLTKVLSQLEPLTTWFMDNDGEIKTLPISDLYGKFQQMIDKLHKDIKDLLDIDYGKLSDNLKKELAKHLLTLEEALRKHKDSLDDYTLEKIEEIKATCDRIIGLAFSKLTKADTIEDLKTMRFLKVGDIVEVLGYYTAGDGAGHKRIIKAEDDGSGVQLSNGLWGNIVHNGEVNVSWVGGVYNSNSKSSQNYQALIKALNTGFCVIISQDYYIEQSGNNIINNNFVLKGENKATLYINIKNRENFFKINSNIKKLYLQNLKIILESSVYDGTLFVIKENIFIEDVNILNNYINFKFNKGLFLEWIGINNLKTLENTGSNYIFINNNVFENTFNSFIVMEDIIFKKMEFSNNTVHNFKRNFLYSDFNYANLNLRPIIVIENNIVTNDDDCFFDETYSGLYYVFILVTAKNVYYRNNIVSGMKSNKNVALYNAYVIADEYFCENNTWKNNLCFSIDKENDELMKAKATLKKHFKYNTFLIEDEFIKKFSVSEKAQWVNLHHVVTATTSELTEISNNYINVPELKLYTGADDIGNFIFKNNNIKSLRFDGNILPYPKKLNKTSDYLVMNNSFDLGVSQTNVLSFYREIGKVKYDDMTITGNIIKINLQDGKEFYGFYGELNSKICTIKDNTFIQELESKGIFNPVQSSFNFKAERLFFNNFYSIANIRSYRCSIFPDLSPSSHNFNYELKIAYKNKLAYLFRFNELNIITNDKYDYNIIFDFDNKEKIKLLFSVEKRDNYYFKHYNSLGEIQETLIDSTNKINMYLLDDSNIVTNQYIQYLPDSKQFTFSENKNYNVLNLKVYIY